MYRLKIPTNTLPDTASPEEIKKQQSSFAPFSPRLQSAGKAMADRRAANRAHALLLCSRLEKEINKQKRLNINRAHALLLYERLQHPELTEIKNLALRYYQ